jgi:hypothetical protein
MLAPLPDAAQRLSATMYHTWPMPSSHTIMSSHHLTMLYHATGCFTVRQHHVRLTLHVPRDTP